MTPHNNIGFIITAIEEYNEDRPVHGERRYKSCRFWPVHIFVLASYAAVCL